MASDSENTLRNTLGLFGNVLQECDGVPMREFLQEYYKEFCQKWLKRIQVTPQGEPSGTLTFLSVNSISVNKQTVKEIKGNKVVQRSEAELT